MESGLWRDFNEKDFDIFHSSHTHLQFIDDDMPINEHRELKKKVFSLFSDFEKKTGFKLRAGVKKENEITLGEFFPAAFADVNEDYVLGLEHELSEKRFCRSPV